MYTPFASPPLSSVSDSFMQSLKYLSLWKLRAPRENGNFLLGSLHSRFELGEGKKKTAAAATLLNRFVAYFRQRFGCVWITNQAPHRNRLQQTCEHVRDVKSRTQIFIQVYNRLACSFIFLWIFPFSIFAFAIYSKFKLMCLLIAVNISTEICRRSKSQNWDLFFDEISKTD